MPVDQKVVAQIRSICSADHVEVQGRQVLLYKLRSPHHKCGVPYANGVRVLMYLVDARRLQTIFKLNRTGPVPKERGGDLY